MTHSLEKCPPCDCTQYGGSDKYNVTRTPIQKWLSQANTAGSTHGINPVVFLAMSSVESDGTYDQITNGSYYGIVQIGQNMLTAYNTFKGTKYALNDLTGNGSNVKTSSSAVALSFDILGQYLGTLNPITNSIALSATSWNGAICGVSGKYFYPFGNKADGYSIPTGASCYGKAVVQLASAYSGWWINPNTNTADSNYFGDLKEVSKDTLTIYNKVCNGN